MKASEENCRIRIRYQAVRQGSSDPSQNVTGPEHWCPQVPYRTNDKGPNETNVPLVYEHEYGGTEKADTGVMQYA